jgi:hypothetical protein
VALAAASSSSSRAAGSYRLFYPMVFSKDLKIFLFNWSISLTVI